MPAFNFQKAPVSDDPNVIADWAEAQFENFAADLQALSLLELVRSYSAPLRPQPGNLIYADGTTYNPGSGEKLYYRNAAGVWVPVASETYVAGVGPFGQCKFVLGSTTTCFLAPFNGNTIKVNGALYSIPSVGVQVTNAGLAASTLYYAYAYISAGALALEFSTTTHATDATAGNIGVEVKSGDNTRSLVGMVQTDAASHFLDDNNDRNVRSWFNDTGVRILSNSSAGVNITSVFPTWQEDTTLRLQGVLWANEQVFIAGQVCATHPTVGAGIYAIPYRNGVSALGQLSVYNQPLAGTAAMNPVGASTVSASDAFVFFSIAGAVSAGTANWIYRTIDVITQRK